MWALQTMHLSDIYLHSTHIESFPGPHLGMSVYRSAGQKTWRKEKENSEALEVDTSL